MTSEDGEASAGIAAAEAEAAEADARAAEARARAARARATEARLRAAEPSPDTTPVPATGRAAPVRYVRRMVRPVAAVLGAAAVLGLLGISTYILRSHRAVEADRQHAAQYSAAARQGVVNMMAINYNTAQADVQRVLDSATGRFKEDFESTSKDLVKALQEGKILTEVDVKSVALQSMTNESAVVLVSAVSQRGDPKATDRDPRTWRAVVTVNREGDQIKVSNLEFV
ncbi:MAG TPA: hypothetical protein PKI77_03055 [Mycobacterium sp.]|nr:hypothetical protein [Mycobacterium sp.]